MNTDSETDPGLDSIAIIGWSARFPGAEDVESFWKIIRDGKESIEFFSDEELRRAGIPESALQDPNYVRAGAKIKDAEMFDADFFAYTPREAKLMDPQHRVFLESAWHALENAGIDTRRCAATIGIFAGTNPDSYMQARHNEPEFLHAPPVDKRLSSDSSFFATRAAFKLNFKGPALTIQTACSTSLVAICVACQHLMTYQCDVALAGAATVQAFRKSGYLFQSHGILSPDGHCRAFDANAGGTVGGEGVATVVLKRLGDALAEGDTVHAVIKGWALNNDGNAKAGFTAPSVDGQAEVIEMAQALAGVSADSIGYVEAHGTGTELGDPVEVAALTQAFSATTDKTNYCSLGSVKANIGHLDAAAGIAGLIKAALMLENRQIPPLLHYRKPNPKIDFEASPFYIDSRLRNWDQQGSPRRAGVSSFGIGGTNAHVILEQAPATPAQDSSRPHHLLLVSARSSSQCGRALENLANWLENHPELPLSDVAYTLQTGRGQFDYSAFCVAENRDDAVAALQQPEVDRVSRSRRPVEPPELAFMFPGQGNQYPNMGLDIYRSEPVFSELVDRCSGIIEAAFGYDLRDMLYPSARQDEAAADETLTRTEFAQPALFVVEYAMARLLMSWGIRAQAFIGHSIGEYVAATLAGVFTLEDALRLVAQRGRLMQSVSPGSMVAVPLSAEQLRERLPDDLAIAAVNQPGMCIVSGAANRINEFIECCERDNLSCHPLRTSHAFHSAMMEQMLDEFSAVLKNVRLAAPDTPFVSNLTGDWIDERQALDPNYWVSQARHAVLFDAGLRKLLQNPARMLVEVGPGNSLSSIARQHPAREGEQRVAISMRHPRDQGNDLATLLQALGQLWQRGVEVDWGGFYAGERRQKVPLPGYPFERKPHWIKISDRQQQARQIDTGAPRKLADIGDWFYVPSWVRQPAAVDIAWPGQSVSEFPEPESSRSWLLFDDRSELSQRLSARLEQDGDRVIAVSYGESYRRDSDSSYQISSDEQDYFRLAEDLLEASKHIDGVVYLWAFGDGFSGSEYSSAESAIESGFYVPLWLVKALNRLCEKSPQRSAADIFFVTRGAQQVTGSEDIFPARSLVAGVNRVCSQELPHLRSRSIDLEFDQQDDATAVLERNVDHLLSELSRRYSPARGEIEIAYRGPYRWARTIEFAPLTSTQPVAGDSSRVSSRRLRHNGVYLITGGLGGIGRALSEFLAENYRARLVLTGRSKLPDAADWDDWLARHGEADSVSRKINFIRTLEAKGAEILWVECDAADFDAMKNVVDSATARFGEINGVIHAAGVPGGGLIQLKDRHSAAEVLAPKVQGALVLDALFDDPSLDFMLFCSSLAAILGGVGQVDYTAANVFLDALALKRHNKNLYTVAINWDTWSEAGMALEADLPAEFRVQLQASLAAGIRSREGVEIFARVLNQAFPQIIVSTRAIDQRIALLDQLHRSTDQDALDADDDVSGTAEESAGADGETESRTENYVAPRNELESKLCDIWQDMFGVSRIGIEDSFFALGGHSLLAVQVISRINELTTTHVSLNDFFDAATIARLASLIDQQGASRTEIDPADDTDSLVDSLSDEEVRQLLAKRVVESSGRQG